MRASQSAVSFRAAAGPAGPVVVRRGQLDLIEGLQAIARRDGLSGAGLARAIGVDHALWSRVRRGMVNVRGRSVSRFGVTACAKIVAVYPELADAAARYLADGFGWPVIRALAELGQATEGVERDPDKICS